MVIWWKLMVDKELNTFKDEIRVLLLHYEFFKALPKTEFELIVNIILEHVDKIYLEGFQSGYVTREGTIINKRTETEEKIHKVLSGMEDLLFYKNQKYGDSALHPIQVFCKSDPSNSLTIRLDDKLSRLVNGSDLNTEEKLVFINLFKRVMGGNELKKNDVSDLHGYLTLFSASKGWFDFSEYMD